MLKHYYEEVKSAFVNNKQAVYISSFILIFSLIFGYLLAPYLHSYLSPVVEDLNQKVETGVVQLTFADIFSNNIIIIFQMFVYGLLFCLSVALLAYNGFFVGYYVAIQEDLVRVLLFLVPHAIFELPSCILACASGLVLFNFFFNFLKSYVKEDLPLKEAFSGNVKKLKEAVIIFLVAVLLMIIAGLVEVYLTIPIASFFLG